MKYYIIAGEASGDLHASNLVKAIKTKDSQASFRGWGGDLMQEAGVELVKHYKDTAFMGFLTVFLNMRTVLRNIRFCKADLLAYKPDVVILVDYAGFNLRIAKFAKKHQFFVGYYIAPKVWAWKESRIKSLLKYVNKLYCILPFEQDYFRSRGVDAFYAGNPLLDAIANRPYQNERIEEFKEAFALDDRDIIALLPGSRKQEITMMLPTMIQVAGLHPEYQFVVAGAPAISDTMYAQLIGNSSVKIVRASTYRLLEQSAGALVASGTATLETALLNIPQVVCYNTKGGRFAYNFGKWLINTKYISLVNLILDKEAVKELIIIDFDEKNLSVALNEIMGEGRDGILKDYSDLKLRMGEAGVSDRCATQLLKDVDTFLEG